MKSLLDDDAWPLSRTVLEMYSLFLSESVHNFHLVISKRVKEAGLSYRGSKNVDAGEGGQPSSFQGSGWSKRNVLAICDAFQIALRVSVVYPG